MSQVKTIPNPTGNLLIDIVNGNNNGPNIAGLRQEAQRQQNSTTDFFNAINPNPKPGDPNFIGPVKPTTQRSRRKRRAQRPANQPSNRPNSNPQSESPPSQPTVTSKDKLNQSELGKYILESVWGKVDGEIPGQPRPNWDYLKTQTIKVGGQDVNAGDHLQKILDIALNPDKQAGQDINQLKADALTIMQMVNDNKAKLAGGQPPQTPPPQAQTTPTTPAQEQPETPASAQTPKTNTSTGTDSPEEPEESPHDKNSDYSSDPIERLNEELSNINQSLTKKRDTLGFWEQQKENARRSKIEPNASEEAIKRADQIKTESDKAIREIKQEINQLQNRHKLIQREIERRQKQEEQYKARSEREEERKKQAEERLHAKRANEMNRLKDQLLNNALRAAEREHNQLKREAGQGAREWGFGRDMMGLHFGPKVPSVAELQKRRIFEIYEAQFGKKPNNDMSVYAMASQIATAQTQANYPNFNPNISSDDA